MKRLAVAGIALLALVFACGGSEPSATKEASMPAILKVTSPAFADSGMIPAVHTCDGEDRSPALAWSGAPRGTASFALICDDPDAPAGTWVHWVLFNIPADSTGLPEGLSEDGSRKLGARVGKNSWKRLGYGGPCPPGGTHRYYFKLYALDARLALAEGADKKALEKAMTGHLLGEGQLMGRYQRR